MPCSHAILMAISSRQYESSSSIVIMMAASAIIDPFLLLLLFILIFLLLIFVKRPADVNRNRSKEAHKFNGSHFIQHQKKNRNKTFPSVQTKKRSDRSPMKPPLPTESRRANTIKIESTPKRKALFFFVSMLDGH